MKENIEYKTPDDSNPELILKYAVENGILDVSSIQDDIAMKNRKDTLALHPYKIWQGKDGKYYTYIPDNEKGRLLRKRNTRKELEDVVVDYLSWQPDDPTVEEVFDEWNDKRLELKKIAPPTHLRNQQFFNRHYTEMGKRKIRSVTVEEWSGFIEEQIPKFNLTAKSFSGLKTITRGFLKYARKKHLIDFRIDDMFDDADISEADFKKTIKEDYEEVFSEDETPIIMEYLEHNCDMINSMILLMFVSGMRAGEVVALKHSDVGDKTIDIRRTETRYRSDSGKYVYDIKEFPKTGAGVRTIVIPESYVWLLEKVNQYNAYGEYIFSANGNRKHTQAVRRRLAKICDELNMYPKSPHKIRKTYGTILLDNNVDHRLVIDQMGHTDVGCTENHYHRNRRNVESKSLIISSLPDFTSGNHKGIKGNQKIKSPEV